MGPLTCTWIAGGLFPARAIARPIIFPCILQTLHLNIPEDTLQLFDKDRNHSWPQRTGREKGQRPARGSSALAMLFFSVVSAPLVTTKPRLFLRRPA